MEAFAPPFHFAPAGSWQPGIRLQGGRGSLPVLAGVTGHKRMTSRVDDPCPVVSERCLPYCLMRVSTRDGQSADWHVPGMRPAAIGHRKRYPAVSPRFQPAQVPAKTPT